jgi:hypothetical protein
MLNSQSPLNMVRRIRFPAYSAVVSSLNHDDRCAAGPIRQQHLLMHRIHLNEVLRDAAIAYAIRPAIERGGFTFAETRDALIGLDVPRPAMIAAVVCPSKSR